MQGTIGVELGEILLYSARGVELGYLILGKGPKVDTDKIEVIQITRPTEHSRAC